MSYQVLLEDHFQSIMTVETMMLGYLKKYSLENIDCLSLLIGENHGKSL